MAVERVQKVLSRMGFGSRREIERWIEQGRIKINRKTCALGDTVEPGDWIHVNDKRVIVREERPAETRVIIYHKPEGEVCTRNDPEGRPTVFDKLPKTGRSRWLSVGRLDINTSGLLLLTTNGELAHRLMHPSHQVEREYAVRVSGTVTRDMLRQLTTEVALEDGPAHFDDIQDGGGEGYNHWYYVVIREGRKREVRRLWEAMGLRVSRLIRVRYGFVILPRSLRKGRVRELDVGAVRQLGESVGLDLEIGDRPPTPASGRRPGKRPQLKRAKKTRLKKKRGAFKRTRSAKQGQ